MSYPIVVCDWDLGGPEALYPKLYYKEPNPKKALRSADLSEGAVELIRSQIVGDHGQSFYSGLRQAVRHLITQGKIIREGHCWVLS